MWLKVTKIWLILPMYCRVGPLVRMWCMRYEAKHWYFKRWANIMGNFKNIPKTLAMQHQRYLCYQLAESGAKSSCLTPTISAGPDTPTRINVCHVHVHIVTCTGALKKYWCIAVIVGIITLYWGMELIPPRYTILFQLHFVIWILWSAKNSSASAVHPSPGILLLINPNPCTKLLFRSAFIALDHYHSLPTVLPFHCHQG